MRFPSSPSSIFSLVLALVIGLFISVPTIAKDKNDAPDIHWDELIHPDWMPDPKLVEQYQAGEVDDDDPRIIEARRKLEMPEQPANPAFDDRRIKLTGYVLPLDYEQEKVTEFLLLPYHGACIHVPPPPTNQTVFVKTDGEGVSIRGMFAVMTVTGNIKIEPVESDLAAAGYTLYASDVKPFELSE